MLNLRFADIFANGWRVLFTQAQLAFYQSGYGQLAIIFPYRRDGAALLRRRDHLRRR